VIEYVWYVLRYRTYHVVLFIKENLMATKLYALPSFQEDPAFYEDSRLLYINESVWFDDDIALASARKPSLCDYDGASYRKE
jgi:hypothetical protein